MKINMQKWAQDIIDSKEVKNLPVLYFPCVKETGLTIPDSLNSAENIAKVMKKVIDVYPDTIAAITGMDLTVDTEAFGGKVKYSKRQAPAISKHVVNDEEGVRNLQIPDMNSGRIKIFSDSIKEAEKVITDRPIFGGMLGPFSLAANIMEVSNALMYTMTDADVMKELLEKSTEYLIERAKEYKESGANGIFIAEPTAGLLSPEQLDEFSSVYVKRIVDAVQDDYFFLVLHNCGNVKESVVSMYNTGCKGFHFGNSVDMRDILPQVPTDVLMFGNVDPSTAFFTGTPESIMEDTMSLLKDMKDYPNFVLSSGCDLAPMVPEENIKAYYEAAQLYNKQQS